MKEKKMIIILTISSILMSISIFQVNHYVFISGMTQFVIAVAVCTVFNLKNVSISRTAQSADRKCEAEVTNKKLFSIASYGCALPAIMVGINMVVLMVVSLWLV